MRRKYALLSLFLVPLCAFAVEWKPISQEELALKTPRLDKNADAEAIFWDVRVYDDLRGTSIEHHVDNYVRIKIFTDRGVKSQSTVDIPYSSSLKTTITDLRGRTIKADGSIADVKSDAIFDKTNVKIGKKLSIKTKSFALPAVEPGVIVEYQWREIYSEVYFKWVELKMYRDIPIWQVTYLVRPLVSEYFPFRMHSYIFNCKPSPWELVKIPETFSKISLSNVPAWPDEPDSPPDHEIRPWVLVYYSDQEQSNAAKFWSKASKDMTESFKKEIKVTGEIKKAVAELVQGVKSEEEQLLKIADYCRTKIRNLSYDVNGMTAEERSKYKPKEFTNTGDTFKNKLGRPADINKLFVAMADAAGFEAYGVRATSSDMAFFRNDLMDTYLLQNTLATAKANGKWRFFDVTNPHIPSGMVDWDEQGMAAVILQGKELALVQIPPSTPEQTQLRRNAKLTLSEDGTLEGSVNIELSGHRAVSTKRALESQSDSKREEDMRKRIQSEHGEVEVTNIKIENVNDPLKPFLYSYNVKVPNYAQRTGKRLFFQPSFFEHGHRARFENAERKTPIVFSYAFSEKDEVSIEIPDGFVLEGAESPGDLKLSVVGEHNVAIAVYKQKTVITKRDLIWGKDGKTLFGLDTYVQMKAIWDEIHKRDEHVLTLREK